MKLTYTATVTKLTTACQNWQHKKMLSWTIILHIKCLHIVVQYKSKIRSQPPTPTYIFTSNDSYTTPHLFQVKVLLNNEAQWETRLMLTAKILREGLCREAEEVSPLLDVNGKCMEELGRNMICETNNNNNKNFDLYCNISLATVISKQTITVSIIYHEVTCLCDT